MLFENSDFDVNMSIFMPDVFNNRSNNILNPNEGFLRGNMFKDEYVPYKNYTYYELVPKNEEEKLLYEIMALTFAINDLNLLLDLNPDNKEAFLLFKKYSKEKEEKCHIYDEKFSPLEVTSTDGAKFNWLDSPWPWDNGGAKYV